MAGNSALLTWLRRACAEYSVEPHAIYQRVEDEPWPLRAGSQDELEERLERRGHLIPLPTEPAALANVVEVSVVKFLLEQLAGLSDAEGRGGTDRVYPDIEVWGPRFGGGYHAVDVKVARRKPRKRSAPTRTQSRITLFTGNTYFSYPQLQWPGMFRAFADYSSHLDVIVLYTFNPESLSHIEDVELIVQEPWRIAAKERSSTTREYIGAVDSLEALRQGQGDFLTEAAFYRFWRDYPFKVGRAVKKQLQKILEEQGAKTRGRKA